MQFIADENIDWPVIERLRADGHVVHAVVEVSPGITDSEVLAAANQRDAVLITADKDFGELVYRRQQLFTGLILVRLAGVAPQAKAQLIADVVTQFGDSLDDAFTVVTATSVRHRPRRNV